MTWQYLGQKEQDVQWLGSTWIKQSKMGVPIARKVSVIVAFETLVSIRLETSS
jgi:hypothetical protein